MRPEDLLHVWWLVAAMLVFMMQVGFLLLETGLIQQRHMAGIAVKTMMMLLASSTAYALFGYGYMWRNSTSPHIDSGEWLFYQTGFASVAATILSGSMAGRTSLLSNVIMAAVVGGVIFPLHGRWVWGDGLLSVAPYDVQDFAGSGCVHLLGGLVALAGAIVAGPRMEKLDVSPDDPIHISPRSLPMAACGVLFLWIGWMGFNGGSIRSADNLGSVGRLVISTCLAASAGGFAVCVVAAVARRLEGASYVFAPYATLSGIMAGMVANSGCCDRIAATSLNWSLLVGGVAGLTAYVMNEVLQRKCRVDDPIEAIAVHAGGGVVGLIFAGLFRKDGPHLLPQFVDIFVLVTIAFVPSVLFFWLLHWLDGRVFRFGRLTLPRIPVRLMSTTTEEDLGLIFDDPSTRIGDPAVYIHYVPRDIKKQIYEFFGLLTTKPLHVARALKEGAEKLINEMKANAHDEVTAQSIRRLQPFLDELGQLIHSAPDVLNRLETGKGEAVELRALIVVIAAQYTERYKNIVTILSSVPAEDVYVEGDIDLTGEAIRMLVSNGVRYSIQRLERGGANAIAYSPEVSISLNVEPGNAPRRVHVCVRDNGVGIDPRLRYQLGQPLQAAQHSGRGSGLGLFVAAHITKVFGGELECTKNAAAPGQTHTEFVMRLPLMGERR